MAAPEEQRINVADDKVVLFQKKQHAVKQWIENMLKIELSSEDLFKSLRNGVILCYLMQHIDERAIPRIQEDTNQIFKLKENVEFFIAACQDMGVPPHKIFRFNDLWDNASMVNVVECLWSLAHIVEEQYEVDVPLSIDESWVPPTLPRTETNSIKKQLAKMREAPVPGKKVKISEKIVLRKLEIMAGNGINIHQYVGSFVQLQSLIRGHLERQKYKKKVRAQAYRNRVAKEILDTETFYVSKLGLCVRIWLNPLNEAAEAGTPIISKDDIRTIFSDITVILAFNTQLLTELESRVGEWHSQACIGDMFVKLMDFLKVYSAYVQNFTTSMSALERVHKKKEVAAYFQKCKAHPDGGHLDLADLLIMPVQRIPRYNLLLSDLLKHTWEDHPDFQNLKEAAARIETIAGYINEKKREAENLQRAVAVAHTLTGKVPIELTAPHRRLLKEGLFDEGKEELMVFLFNDYVMLAKPEKLILKCSYKYKDCYKLSTIHINPTEDTSLEFVNVRTHKVLVRLNCKSQQERDVWLKFISAARTDLKETELAKERLRERDEAKSTLSAEAKLALRRRAHTGEISIEILDDGMKKLQKLRDRKETLEKQLEFILQTNAEQEAAAPVVSTLRGRKTSKRQRKDTERIAHEMQEELDEVAARIAELEAKGIGTAKALKRKATAQAQTAFTYAARSKGKWVRGEPGEKSKYNTLPLDSGRSRTPGEGEDEDGRGETESAPVPAVPLIVAPPEDRMEQSSGSTQSPVRCAEPVPEGLSAASAGERHRTFSPSALLRKLTQNKAEGSDDRKEKKQNKKQDEAKPTKSSKKKKKKKQEEERKDENHSQAADTESDALVSSGSAEPPDATQQDPLVKSPEPSDAAQEEKSAAEQQPASASEEASAEPPDPANDQWLKEGETYLPYAELKKKPKHLDRTRLEAYLTPAEFGAVFGMTKDAFYELPVWRQRKKRGDVDLM